MSKPMTKDAIKQINLWLKTLQDGDKIDRRGNVITLSNGSGCWLDEVKL